MTILRVEGGIVHEIYTAANYIASGEGWSIWLPSTAWAKTVPIITMIAIWMLIPTGKSIYVDAMRRKADTHVSITSFAYNFYLKVVQTTSRRYRVCCANTSSVFVSFTVTWKKNAAILIWESDYSNGK